MALSIDIDSAATSGDMTAVAFLERYAPKAAKEREKALKLQQELSNCGYAMPYMLLTQQHLHDKYR